jgi:hypothetical protein
MTRLGQVDIAKGTQLLVSAFLNKSNSDSLVRRTKNSTPKSGVISFQFYLSLEVNLNNTKIPACFLIVRGILILKLYRQVSPYKHYT